MSVATNNVFAYNPKSEIVGTSLMNGTTTYSYDWQGNRYTTTNGTTGVVYVPNGLNQYADVNGIVPEYDPDGNLTAIPGTCAMAYDGRNQMTFYSNANDRVWNTYDHQGRRVLKVSHGGTETQSWEVAESRFLYDDWNLLSELQYSSIPLFQSSIDFYLWGLDLSGTEQGAGGIGGLLATFRNGDWYIPLTDANGNITEYVNSSGSTVAHYEYDAFGNTLAQSGLMAGDFKFRFSTKYFDAESGLYYYGLRYYDPSWGRWLNRDPIGEDGGLNLYGFCGNDGVNQVDALGLRWLKHSYSSYDKNKKRIYADYSRKSRKIVTSGYMDKIDDFDIELDFDDFDKWLKPEDGKPLPTSRYEQMKECRVFSIPNNVYIFRGTLPKGKDNENHYNYEYYRSFPFDFSYILNQKMNFQKDGLNVVIYFNSRRDDITAALANDDTWGISYFGHGAAWHVWKDGISDKQFELSTVIARSILHHGLSFVYHQGCFGGMTTGNFDLLVSKNGEYKYHEGLSRPAISTAFMMTRKGTYSLEWGGR